MTIENVVQNLERYYFRAKYYQEMPTRDEFIETVEILKAFLEVWEDRVHEDCFDQDTVDSLQSELEQERDTLIDRVKELEEQNAELEALHDRDSKTIRSLSAQIARSLPLDVIEALFPKLST